MALICIVEKEEFKLIKCISNVSLIMKCDQYIAWNFLIGSLAQVFAYCGNDDFINGKLVNGLISLLNISHRRDCLG